MIELLQNIIKQKVFKNFNNFKLLSKSSNRIYSFNVNEKNYILKTPNLKLSELSPFWKQLQFIFGSNFYTQTESVTSLISFLSKNPYIKLPKIIYTNNTSPIFQIFEHVPGKSYEPDTFPKNTEYQLGQYVGWMHSHSFNGFGIYSSKLLLSPSNVFYSKCLKSIKLIIKKHWSNNKEVVSFFEKIKEIIPDNVGNCSLIMPDISANQFIYTRDFSSISGLVDIDAYVIGPNNFELTVIEMCLSNPFDFKKGYETHSELPRFETFRSFYRFLLYLNDPGVNQSLDRFLNTSKHFTSSPPLTLPLKS